ncbi:L-lactate MFS transporter [Desertibacillus haloalkaliphilus]|uniref:L-lactate MFS transporter n=1 Tax=Desertibacillus haloalkaliphilus TaxID=1328930 RepID=UPI001C259432|nr:OFA family MFS transporter [Desertibacillus haloalkaliphilus]MBU8908682.1 OFA family MFS transporter [Desertibacillus haloalkaliphilus]
MKQKNRWLIALSAIFIHLSIGSVYAYSVFQTPMVEELGWTGANVTVAFTIAIFFLGTSAAFFGRFVEKRGPRVSAFVAAVLFSGGLIGTGLSISAGSLYGFYLTYGVIGGFGLGIGYIAPVSTLVKWFPDRRGLATGMAVFGFGAGSLIASPVAASLIEMMGLTMTFYLLGGVYFILMALGASYIARPPEDWMPASQKEQTDEGKLVKKEDLSQLTANEAIKTKRFWLLWWMMFINISAGIMLIAVASPMAQETVGMSTMAAATVVGVMGLFNGGGRIAWASFSDYIGRENVYLLFFIVQVVAFLILPMVTNAIIFQILMYLIVSMYGGGFASLPAFIGDMFGTKQLGAIHGYLLTSWAVAGVVGPTIVSTIRETMGNYDSAFYIFAVLLATALGAAYLTKRDINGIRQEKLKLANQS